MGKPNKRAVLCEFCGTRWCYSPGTVCMYCDAELEREQAKVVDFHAAKWAAVHKCRGCGKGLTVDRYFLCHTCDVPHMRETETIWPAHGSGQGYERGCRKVGA